MGSLPGGDPLKPVIQGGPEYGSPDHHPVLRAARVRAAARARGLLAAHIALFRRHGVTPPAKLNDAELKRKTQPFWPNQLFLDVAAMAICAAVMIVMTFRTHGAELFAPADPASNFVARPEWYFLFLYQLLKYFEGPAADRGDGALARRGGGDAVRVPVGSNRATSRRPSARWPALMVVGLLMPPVTALTAPALVEDAHNERLPEGLEARRGRSRSALASSHSRASHRPAAIAVFDNDPKEKARSCSRSTARPATPSRAAAAREAPSFEDYNSRDWLPS